jgi:hypothetical protein
MTPAGRRPDYEPDDGPLTDEQLEQLRAMAKNDLPTGKITNHQSLFSDSEEFFDRARATAKAIDAGTYESPDEEPIKKSSVLAGLDSMWSSAKKLVVKDSEAQHAPLEIPNSVEKNEKEEQEKEARRRWKEENPDDTIHHQEALFRAGRIDRLPWHVSDLVADNEPAGNTGEVKGFGTSFPVKAVKGDMFLRVDQLPSVLYKYNGVNWIEVDKSLSDQHAYDDAYIDHLILKISTGEYDPELLSNAERDRIEQRLRPQA